ncbi:hypothetical protein BKA62DRAFT_834058 [Auriculariales sp. MPI-PUGE-AT-0066]|nr:hypothetical protein BKA62DRAFT_834058 [Auriculariales sp. MPI-PUGE-AT-0066]
MNFQLSFVLMLYIIIWQAWALPTYTQRVMNRRTQRVMNRRTQTMAYDEVGTRWLLVGDSGEQVKQLSRSDALLGQQCPNQAAAIIGRDGHVAYARNLPSTNTPNASVTFNTDDVDFNIFVGLHRGPGTTAKITAMVDWIRNDEVVRAAKQMTFTLPDIAEPAGSSPIGCSVILPREWFRTNIVGIEQPKSDIPRGAIRTIWLLPGSGATGIFVFNMTRGVADITVVPESQDQVPAASESDHPLPTSQSGMGLITPSDSLSFETAAPTATPALSSNNTTTDTPKASASAAATAAIIIAFALALLAFPWYRCCWRRRDTTKTPPAKKVLQASWRTIDPSSCGSGDPVPTYTGQAGLAPIQASHLARGSRFSSRSNSPPPPDYISSNNSNQESQIICAARRAGIDPQALLNSLDKMAVDQNVVSSTAPPVYT